jgi:hypothetical protein
MNHETERPGIDGGTSPLRINLNGDIGDLADTLLKVRALSALDCRAKQLPIHRKVRFAARRPLEEIFDDLATGTSLSAQRLESGSVLLDGPGVFVDARGRRKTDYTSGTFAIWAEDLARLDEVRAKLEALVGPQATRQEIFTIDWHFKGLYGLTNIAVDEITDPDLFDEAYPMLEPVQALIDRYLRSAETVLVLQGPPGTGKTRLVRGMLGAMSRRKGDSAKVLYTADRRTLENDEIFIEFITGDHDAFVIEDADHILTPRADGNDNVHRFLSVADGVVRALGRKIIFTTNLPNVGDIDEALIRPGRCFGVLRTRNLDRAEARRLLEKVCVCNEDAVKAAAALPHDARSLSLASVFRAAIES